MALSEYNNFKFPENYDLASIITESNVRKLIYTKCHRIQGTHATNVEFTIKIAIVKMCAMNDIGVFKNKC